MKHYIIILTIFLSSCGPKKEAKAPASNPQADALLVRYSDNLLAAKAIEHPINKWLTPDGCDAMIWAGKYSCGGGKPDILAAEYPGSHGKFSRRPLPACWSEETGDVGSKTTWSKDMAMGGLIPHAICTKDLALLSRHRDYGDAHSWNMGEPLADGRAIYTPSLIGLIHQVIYKLGGADNVLRKTPSVYSSGLVDYQAHLQIMDIWIRGLVTGTLGLLGSEDAITKNMLARVKEHAAREPECPLYQYMNGLYAGDLSAATNLLLASNAPKCSYVRETGAQQGADMSEWLFVTAQVLRAYGKL